ncbi:hypothetical protein BBJ28_00013234 [Nothophytophthora sp. Chile5]|nr:hypothetical protein BBJ28_00013234 [Nothophytophthora sp. Chile5]
MNELAQRVWQRSFQKDGPETDAELALHRRLLSLAAEHEADDESQVESLLLLEVAAKVIYMDPSWGYVDAANIGELLTVCVQLIDTDDAVSRVDDCIIALQEQPKKQFLDPLSWDLLPHKAVLAVVEAVLLLFEVQLPPPIDDEAMWEACWGLWIVKNIDAHSGGWEWMAQNEPTGLFTKPYALSAGHLDRVFELLGRATNLAPPGVHRCWHHLPAYACLRDWIGACATYLHMVEHCLPEFDGFAAVQQLVTPPQRTPKTNTWFRCETEDGIEYFYNRLYQSLTLERPDDFDGASSSIPSVVQELIDAALQTDAAIRIELERRGKQRVVAQLLDQDEWVECLDLHTQTKYYYSMKHYQVAAEPPEHGAFVSYRESVAFAAVLRLQAAYRRRRLMQKTQVRKAKRSALPTFASFAGGDRAKPLA